jgi:hypothetical protein
MRTPAGARSRFGERNPVQRGIALAAWWQGVPRLLYEQGAEHVAVQPEHGRLLAWRQITSQRALPGKQR